MGSLSLLQERTGTELGKDRFLSVFGCTDHGGKSWPDLRLWAQHVFSAHLGGRKEGGVWPWPIIREGRVQSALLHWRQAFLPSPHDLSRARAVRLGFEQAVW